MNAAPRTGRELIEATRPFSVESRATSWFHLVSTFALLAAGTALAASPLPWLLRACFSVLDGLLAVRLFILYHDHLHGSVLNGSWLARSLLYPISLWVMAPPNVWRETHNYHHAHTAKLVGSNIGSYAMMTTDQWAQATAAERRRYKFIRHPATMLFGYFTAFMLEMGLLSFLRSPRKRWDSLVAVLLNWAVSALLWWRFGFAVFFFCHFLPVFVACAIGAYLFYAQHNYPDAFIQPREKWAYDRAALESSSYMEMGPVLHWFTGNIGYHHVHHLNPGIPFYRLPEAMAAIPELQAPGTTRLTVREIARCFQLKLWDPAQGRLVGYPRS